MKTSTRATAGQAVQGAPGGAGGAGANVTVRYVTPAMVTLQTGPTNVTVPIPLIFDPGWVAGGQGGAVGPGGSPGASFVPISEEPRPNPGAPGPAGVPGANGTLSVQQVDATGHWRQVTATLPAATRQAWAHFRYQLGCYYYRSFVLGDPQRGGYLARARTEFQATAQLATGDSAQPAKDLLAAATEQISWIETGLNALGLPRDLSIKPDFDDFEQTYVQYAPVLAPLFQDVVTLIGNAVAVKAIDNQLSTAATAVTKSLPALTDDSGAAQAALSGAQMDSNNLDHQLNDIQSQIAKTQADLDAATYRLPGAQVEQAAATIMGALINLIPGVAAIKGVVGTVVKMENDPSVGVRPRRGWGRPEHHRRSDRDGELYRSGVRFGEGEQ